MANKQQVDSASKSNPAEPNQSTNKLHDSTEKENIALSQNSKTPSEKAGGEKSSVAEVGKSQVDSATNESTDSTKTVKSDKKSVFKRPPNTSSHESDKSISDEGADEIDDMNQQREKDQVASKNKNEEKENEDSKNEKEVLESQREIKPEELKKKGDYDKILKDRDESNAYLKAFRKDEGNISGLRLCLAGAFANTGEIHDFCEDYLGEMIYELPENAEIISQVRKIIAYCKSRERLDILYEFLANERPNRYNLCFERYEDFDSINRITRFKKSSKIDRIHEEHPLEKDDKTVRHWFFNELNQGDQIYLIALALFEGARPQQIQEFSSDLENLLIKEAKLKKNISKHNINDKAQVQESKGESQKKLKKTPIEIDRKKNESIFTNEYELRQRLNCELVKVAYDSDYGQTLVDSLRFVKPNQGEKILSLLHYSLSSWLPQLYSYLFDLGKQIDMDSRRLAAEAVGRLMSKVGFFDLTNNVLHRWAVDDIYTKEFLSKARSFAKHHSEFYSTNSSIFSSNNFEIDNISMNISLLSASEALAVAASDSESQNETLEILRYWISSDRLSLNIIAILTYLRIGISHPQETLSTIEKIVIDKQHLLYLLPSVIFSICKGIYNLYPETVVEFFQSWIVNSDQRQGNLLSYTATLFFLDIVRICDVPLEDTNNTREKVADIIIHLWSGLYYINRSEVQKATTNLVFKWINHVIDIRDENSEPLKIFQALAKDVQLKYSETNNVDRLSIYLKRWKLDTIVFNNPLS